MAGKRRSGKIVESAAICLPNRRAGGGDDYCVAHVCSFKCSTNLVMGLIEALPHRVVEKPPSSGMNEPVMLEDAGEARHMVVHAASPGVNSDEPPSALQSLI